MAKISIACIAVDKHDVLVAHRNPVGQMGGRWEFPGGKVEKDETDVEAVIREFSEEFGVTVKVGARIAVSTFEHNNEVVQLHAYRVFVPHKGKIFKYHLTEHSEYKWVHIDEIKQLNFVDSDLGIYSEVKKYILSV